MNECLFFVGVFVFRMVILSFLLSGCSASQSQRFFDLSLAQQSFFKLQHSFSSANSPPYVDCSNGVYVRSEYLCAYW